jgi:Zn-dependent M28 family amino/carboxypeptidase
MFCLDLVGYYSDEKDSQDFPFSAMGLIYGTKGDFIGVLGRTQDRRLIAAARKAFQRSVPLRVEAIAVPKVMQGPPFALSDHREFWAVGYPALFFTDTANYRNKNYHKPTDTWDTLDYDRLAQVPVGLYHLILALDATK